MSDHIPWEALVDYWAKDVPSSDVDRIDDHLFACAACTRESEAAARIVRAIRGAIPVLLEPAELDRLRASGLRIEENTFAAGGRTEVHFDAGKDLLIHHLGGLDLHDVDRVHVLVKSEASGATLVEEPFAPFDAARGELLIACQRHFAAFPSDIVFEVRTLRRAGAPTTTMFYLPHVFA